MSSKSEFSVADQYHYSRLSSTRWIISHLARYKGFLGGFVLFAILTNILNSFVPTLAGVAFNALTQGSSARSLLLTIALTMVGIILVQGVVDLSARLSVEVLSKRFARDAREELYVSLLGKSQTFHNRQRVGDIMARASNDMNELRNMVSPGFDVIFDSFTSLVVILIFVAFINLQLLLVPLLFTVALVFSLRYYSRQLTPVSDQMRAQFGDTNALLNEAVVGVEVVKATAQEKQEIHKFSLSARRYRDFYVKSGQI